jgi:hypothetical protein
MFKKINRPSLIVAPQLQFWLRDIDRDCVMMSAVQCFRDMWTQSWIIYLFYYSAEKITTYWIVYFFFVLSSSIRNQPEISSRDLIHFKDKTNNSPQQVVHDERTTTLNVYIAVCNHIHTGGRRDCNTKHFVCDDNTMVYASIELQHISQTRNTQQPPLQIAQHTRFLLFLMSYWTAAVVF